MVIAEWQPDQTSIIRLKSTHGEFSQWATPRFALTDKSPFAYLFNEAIKRYNPHERDAK